MHLIKFTLEMFHLALDRLLAVHLLMLLLLRTHRFICYASHFKESVQCFLDEFSASEPAVFREDSIAFLIADIEPW